MNSFPRIIGFLLLFFGFGILFQNCSGDSGGIIVGNPLSESPRTVEVGFKALSNMDVNIDLCVGKFFIDVIEFHEDIEDYRVSDPIYYPEKDYLHPAQYEVGRAYDLLNNDLGIVKAYPNDDGSWRVGTFFEGEDKRLVELRQGGDAHVYRLELPDGIYGPADFNVFQAGCPTINDHSIVVSNPFGQFFSDHHFLMIFNEQFQIEGDSGASLLLPTTQLYQEVQNVQSNAELDGIVDGGRFSE